MPIEPTEDDARRLLAKAAATIKVDEAAAMTLTGLPEPHHRRWPILAAAAAVVLAIGGGYLVSKQMGDQKAGPVDGPVVEKPHELGDNQMPSVIGMTVGEARRVLEARGATVVANHDNATCAPEGTVIVTNPAVGAPIAPGDRVLLSIADDVAMLSGPIRPIQCGPRQDAVWELVRFARGLDGPPAFAPAVTVSVRNGESRSLTSEEALDPVNWKVCDDAGCHSALAALTEMLTRQSFDVAPPGLTYNSPFLMIQDLRYEELVDPWRCPSQKGEDPEWDGTYAVYLYPADAMAGCDSVTTPVLGVRIEHGAIAEVAILATRDAEADNADRAAAEQDSAQAKAADDLVAWAQGAGPAPSFADEVQLLDRDRPWATISAAEAIDRQNWGMCDGLESFEVCKDDPLRVLDSQWESVFQVRWRTEEDRTVPCAGPAAELPRDLASAIDDDMVELGQGEPKNCGDWYEIELWVNDGGEIYAVNMKVVPKVGPLPDFGDIRIRTALKFVEWARGPEGDAPPRFADRVRVMFFGGGAFGHTGWTDEPEWRGGYSGCSGLGFPACGVDPVGVVHQSRGQVLALAGRSACPSDVPQRFANAEQDVVRLELGGSDRCAAMVELWIDADGVIYGVNQAGAPS